MKAVILILVVLSFAGVSKAADPVDNFHLVSQGIYRGARPTDSDQIKALKKMGIKTVVNLQGGDVNDGELGWLIPYVEDGETQEERELEQSLVAEAGMNYFNFPLNSLDRVTKREADKIADAIKVLSDKNNQPVFLHCAHGADRTGLVIALYRVIIENWPVQKAHREMVALGHDLLHQAFTHELDEFLLDPKKVAYLKAKILQKN